jgi:hypothetical protein
MTMPDVAVLDGARHKFFKYLQEHGVAKEYSWQALEEYAEGAVGGLSLYWPEAARRDCAEDAMVRAEWVVQRFDNERDSAYRSMHVSKTALTDRLRRHRPFAPSSARLSPLARAMSRLEPANTHYEHSSPTSVLIAQNRAKGRCSAALHPSSSGSVRLVHDNARLACLWDGLA